MKFSDIPADILTVRVKRTDIIHSDSDELLSEQPVFSVKTYPSRPDEFEVRLKERIIFVKPTSKANIHYLGNELAADRAMLAQFANPAQDGSIELQIAFFTDECLEWDTIEIGVDEYVEKAYEKTLRSKFTGKELHESLERHCRYVHGDQQYFFLIAGPAIDIFLKSVTEENSEEVPEKIGVPEEKVEEVEESDEFAQLNPKNIAPKPHSRRNNSLCILGKSIRFIATETQIPNEKSIYFATRLTKIKNQPDRAVRLAKGTLKFVDWTQAGPIQAQNKAQMSRLNADVEGYFRRWDEYGDHEGELLLKHARNIGVLYYSDLKENRDGTVTIQITEALDSALDNLEAKGFDTVEYVDRLPDYLENLDLKFSEWVCSIEEAVERDRLLDRQKNKEEEAIPNLKIKDFDEVAKLLTLEIENLPPSGMLIQSLRGDIAQIKRRVFARKAILEARDVSGKLGPLIEAEGKIFPARPPHPVEPLNNFVLKKVFANQPTSKQIDAIKIALETPDIAVIQGPPGTGKTTVIAAILERLNQMARKRGVDIKGVVLLTGLQHDAVENMINRLSLNSIPVPKFGRRSGADEDDLNKFERELETWCSNIAVELRTRNPQITNIEKETEIRNLCLQYVNSPSRRLAANLAKKIADLGITILGEEYFRRATKLAEKFSKEKNFIAESNPLLETVRRLRIRPDSFADDGPDRATDALEDLKDFIDDNEKDLLDRASLWHENDSIPPFLKELAALKKKFLIDFTAPPVFRVEKHNDEIISLAEEAIKKIKIAGFTVKDARAAALAEFLAELESNPYGMIDAVTEYSFAFAATCQQSVNRLMQRQKGITGYDANQKMEYEYVIVDEAARVMPRDLMVPMVQGKRIILVGDHRQLPHIVDENVIQSLSGQDQDDLLKKESEIERDEKKWASMSLFEYLFVTRLPQLYEPDRPPRLVTLDKQFRMHRLLGDFISRNFYERFNPSERFFSERDDIDFAHNLSNTNNRPAIWLDVPSTKGSHRRKGTSWTRLAEATAIAEQLQTWMNSIEGENLSFGVISFYKAQAELIKKQLGRISDNENRLRIGTVDSFQGMEFDVVFLSMVRTVWKPKAEERAAQARGLFGHLCLYNRLNVAMSRQKKLLVVVGDSGLVQNELAEEFIPGLVDFFKLCHTEGVVL